MVDVHTPEQRTRNMRAIRGKDTKPEMRVRRYLHAKGFRYRLHLRTLPGTPDLVFPSRKKVIFVNGCYWHSHECKFGLVQPKTNEAFWKDKRERTIARDREVRRQLSLIGWQSMTVWECQLDECMDIGTSLVGFLDERGNA